MKKIMIYCHTFYPQNSGYANAFLNFVKALLDNDKSFYIYLVTPYQLGNSKELEIERLKIIRLKPKINIKKIEYYLNQYIYAKEVSKLFKKYSANLLFVETFDSEIFLNSLSKDIYNKLVVRIHATNETEYTMFYNRLNFIVRRFLIKNFLLKKIKWIVSTNNFHIRFAKRYYLKDNVIEIGNHNFFILPNPIDKIFSENECCAIENKNKLKIFLLGRMNYLGNNQKGFTDFFYALKLLDNNILNKLDITVVGKGNMKKYLEKLSNNIKNIKFIEYLPHDEVINYLKKSDIVVLPSRYEGLSMFALEALATGNIVIFSRTGGLIDLVDQNGMLFEPQNIEALANSIKQIVNYDYDRLYQMKKMSLSLAREKYSPKIVCDKFNVLYDLVTGAK